MGLTVMLLVKAVVPERCLVKINIRNMASAETTTLFHYFQS